MTIRVLKTALAVSPCATVCGCATQYKEAQVGQEKNACNEIGIHPGSGSFATCVANLDASIYEDSHSAEH